MKTYCLVLILACGLGLSPLWATDDIDGARVACPSTHNPPPQDPIDPEEIPPEDVDPCEDATDEYCEALRDRIEDLRVAIEGLQDRLEYLDDKIEELEAEEAAGIRAVSAAYGELNQAEAAHWQAEVAAEIAWNDYWACNDDCEALLDIARAADTAADDAADVVAAKQALVDQAEENLAATREELSDMRTNRDAVQSEKTAKEAELAAAEAECEECCGDCP